MTTPVLSKKQQKKSLSAKKGPVKGLRNVLAHPQQTYWPVLKSEQCPEFETFFKKIILPLKSPVERMPWSKFRSLNKEQRLEAKKKIQESKQTTLNTDIVKAVITGINAVTRSLEKNQICSILLDSNIDPPLLVKHIVLMAQYKKVPILLVPFLKTALSEMIGFTSAVFALKNIVSTSTNHHFHSLHNKILKLSLDYPPPTNLMHLLQDEEITENLESEMSLSINETLTDNQKNDDNSEKTKPVTVSSNIYMYRSSVNERAFVPPNAQLNNECNKQNLSDFIGLGDDSSENDEDIMKIPKKKRYIDIDTDSNVQNKLGLKQSNEQCLLIKECELTGEVCKHSKRTKLLVTNDNKDMEMKKNSKMNSQKRKMPDVAYMSLKIARMQGNNNRVKATKLPKNKRKQP